MAASAARAGPYELLKQLSSGGSGEVYVARRAGSDGEPRIAVKWMLSYLAGDAELVTRFLDEVRLLARMRHPNIVQIVDVGMSDGRPWLAMELVEGVSLYTLLERCRQRSEVLPLPVVRRIAAGLLDALTYAHTVEGLQVIHRDVSPSNVLVSVDGAVRLTDFGLARATTNWAKTSPGGLGGIKLGTTAPEVALGGAAVDQRADVFGAGVTLFETLTLQHAFRRPGSSDMQTLEAVAKGDSVVGATVRPGTPAEMDAALQRAIRPAPAERFATTAELKAAFVTGEVAQPGELGAWVRRLCPEELARFFALDELPMEPFDAPTVTFTLGETAVLTSPGTDPGYEPGPSPLRRRNVVAGVASALVAGAVVLGVASWLRRRGVSAALVPQPPTPDLPEMEVVEDVPDAGAALDVTPELELSPNRVGYLTAEGEPPVVVLLDGKPLGTTPLKRVSVPTGRHVLTFKTRHGEVRQKIFVTEGKALTLRVKR